jgi:hypothetical protein
MCHGHHGRGQIHMMYKMQCGRHFLTKEEKVQHLEEYKKWLELEAKGVEEMIKELKKAS